MPGQIPQTAHYTPQGPAQMPGQLPQTSQLGYYSQHDLKGPSIQYGQPPPPRVPSPIPIPNYSTPPVPGPGFFASPTPGSTKNQPVPTSQPTALMAALTGSPRTVAASVAMPPNAVAGSTLQSRPNLVQSDKTGMYLKCCYKIICQIEYFRQITVEQVLFALVLISPISPY